MKQLSTECLRLKEESVARTTQLEREMRTREEQHLKEVESLSGKHKEQEAHVEGRIVNYISLRPHTCSTTSCLL